MTSSKAISRIAIVGGGPVGIACAKYLLAEKAFKQIDIFEQRDRVGGIWNLSTSERSRRIPIPQTDPRYGSIDTIGAMNGATDTGETNVTNNESLEFESPLYDYLETNIPKDFMKYSDMSFPENCPLFPSHQEVLQYLEDYAEGVRHLIRFNTQVRDVRLECESECGERVWKILFSDLRDGSIVQDLYDAVVVANGHYTVPHVPDIDGLAQWNEAYPGSVIHSKAYRKPEAFKNQKVLIIGNSASGLDLAAQIGQFSNSLYLSSRSESIFGQTKAPWLQEIDEIVEFLHHSKKHRAVRTKSGTVFSGFDAVVFATGYYYSFPFLSSLEPAIITDGLRTRSIYQNFIHTEYPELAFPVLNTKVIPFGLAENQAAVIARLWSGRLPMPLKQEMLQWVADTKEKKGSGKNFHLQTFPEDGAQMNELYQWASTATKVSGLENEGNGKFGTRWDEPQVWLRSCLAAVRSAYRDKKEDRRKVRTLEELGFSFDDWKSKAKPEDLELFQKAKCSSWAT